MKRWIVPGAVAVVVAAAVTAATVVPGQSLPTTAASPATTRVSVVCPAFDSATAAVKVAAVGVGAAIRTSKLTSPQQAQNGQGVRVVTDPGEPVRVSAPRDETFSAASAVLASDGADRGLAATGCVAPQAEHWFAGVDLSKEAESKVVLVNLDSTEAAVDLTVYGKDGTVGAAPRGIEVPGNSEKPVSLSLLNRTSDPVTVEVSTSEGRVAAFVRQTTWAAKAALGADWVALAAAPATELVIPGVPAGDGVRRLVVTNPTDRTAAVTINALTDSGRIALAGASSLEVPPASTRSVAIDSGLGGAIAGLTLSSNQKVTAAVQLDTGGSDATNDPAVTAATAALPADGIWALPVGRSIDTVLQLTNPGDQDATVALRTGTEANAAPRQVKVTASSTVSVALPQATTTVVRLQTTATDLRGALISTGSVGKVQGLAVLDLSAEEFRAPTQKVVYNPQVGG